MIKVYPTNNPCTKMKEKNIFEIYRGQKLLWIMRVLLIMKSNIIFKSLSKYHGISSWNFNNTLSVIWICNKYDFCTIDLECYYDVLRYQIYPHTHNKDDNIYKKRSIWKKIYRKIDAHLSEECSQNIRLLSKITNEKIIFLKFYIYAFGSLTDRLKNKIFVE